MGLEETFGIDDSAPAAVAEAPAAPAAPESLRPANFTAFIADFWPEWQQMKLFLANLERERLRPFEMVSYRCQGLVPDGKGGVEICGAIVQAKGRDFRSYDERVVCPNPRHTPGELTPMVPIKE